MSADAMDEQKMRVLLDYQNTENELTALASALEAKAKLYAKFVTKIRSATSDLYLPNLAHHDHNVTQSDIYELPKIKDVDSVFVWQMDSEPPRTNCASWVKQAQN